MVFISCKDYQLGSLPMFRSIDERLSRYEHESFQRSSSLHRDLPAIILILVFLFLVALVLTQIILLQRKYSRQNSTETRILHEELRQMDRTIEKVLKKDSSTIDQWKYFFDFQTHSNQFEHIFDENSKSNFSTRQKKFLCNEVPPNLQGRIFTENSTFVELTMKQIEEHFPKVELGGRWSPTNCYSRHHVAIIIPYRDRFEQLTTFLYYLHGILQRQELDYQIFVSEQVGNETYNKGVLMNAAFIHAASRYYFRCFVFHDVDLIPEDDRIMYSCSKYPRHMSVAVDELHYQLMYEELIGGVLNVPREDFIRVNGHSDLYWGWGAEDDDLYYRIKKSSIRLIRLPAKLARYRMIRHTKRTPTNSSVILES